MAGAVLLLALGSRFVEHRTSQTGIMVEFDG
jgi:hypothetical protein